MVGLLLVHEPPGVASASVAVLLMQSDDGPVMAAGSGLTVNGAVTVQPEPREYVMVTVPAVMPDTEPDDEPMVAMEVLLLVQVPPPAASVSRVPPDTQTRKVPPIGAGPEFTVMVFVAVQPDGSV